MLTRCLVDSTMVPTYLVPVRGKSYPGTDSRRFLAGTGAVTRRRVLGSTWILFIACIFCAIVPASEAGKDEQTVSLREHTNASTLFDDSLFIDIAGGFYYQSPLSSSTMNDLSIHQPDYLSPRRKYESYLTERWQLGADRMTDSPLAHGASFIQLLMRRRLSRGLHVSASITADHRGFSLGTYNHDDVAFYPRFLVAYHGKPLGALGSAFSGIQTDFRLGVLEDLRFYEGLTLYNLDCQGGSGYLQSGRFRYTHLRISDLWAGIGLAIDDLIDNSIALLGLPVHDSWKADLQIGCSDYGRDREGKSIDVLNLSAGLYPDMRRRIYGQLGYRFTDLRYNSRLCLASLVGARGEMHSRAWDIRSRVEHRYYGGIFNYKRSQERSVHYRRTSSRDTGNSIGSQLYPVELFGRPFSQWAVFAEYHKRYLNALTWHTVLRRDLVGATRLHLEADLNAIWSEDEDAFLYAFLKAGLVFEPVNQTYLLVGLTNKAMNLDRHYPTFYQIKQPVLHLELIREVDVGSVLR